MGSNGHRTTYWTRLDGELRPRSPQPSGREMPAAVFEPPDDLTRRSVFKLMGSSLALAGLAACRRPEEHIVPLVNGLEGVVPGVPRHYATTLPLGSSAYGLLVETHDGRPTKVDGNPLHPASLGGTSALLQASILDLYDPDRSRGVRHGDEGSDREAFAAAWSTLAEKLAADGGASLAVVSEGFASPTLARLRAELLARFPAARWVVWDPLADDAAFAAWGGRPLYRLDAAEVVVTLDADLLLTEPDALAHTRAFADRRDPEGKRAPCRLYAVESALSLTGANADHRLRLQSRRIEAFAAALAGELGAGGGGVAADLPPEVAARLRALAADLRRAGSRGLVAAGRCQPPSVHRLARAINQALGSVGTTVTVQPLADVGWQPAAGLAALAAALRSGEVSTAVVLGGNPAFDAPADLRLGEALAAAPRLIHLGMGRDETGTLAEWHLPQAHPFESWGDARSADGTVSVVQPLIAPLHGGVSAIELVALLARGEWQAGHDLVRETWRERFGATDEEGWRRVLHDGLLAGAAGAAGTAGTGGPEMTAPAGAEVEATAAPAQPAAPPSAAIAAEGLEVVFLASPLVWGGRAANNAWLQELPHPVAKTSWGNTAWISPATARELGVASGDHVTVRLGEAAVTLPALVLPGQADGSIALETGYGRRWGRVGEGVGVDVGPLRQSSALWIAGGARLERAAGDTELTMMQEQWEMEGRDLVREASLEEYRRDPSALWPHDEEMAERNTTGALFPAWSYDQGHQWGMAIDLARCTGCMACVVACQSENNIPVVGAATIRQGRDMHWLRVDRYFSGPAEDPQVVHQPVPCMHCENAPCEQVCPVAATVHDGEGLNLMVYNRCIGTRYCSNNCPYKVRRFNFFNYTKDTPELLAMAMNPDVTVRSRGVMEKCSYCLQRITEGKRRAAREERPLADGDVRTACQEACPAGAISFGDLRLEGSEVARRKGSPRDYVLLAELANRPRTSYLAKVRNPNPEWPA